MSNVQKELYEAIQGIDDDDAKVVLDFLMRFVVRDDIATAEDVLDIEQARKDFAKGDFTILEV